MSENQSQAASSSNLAERHCPGTGESGLLADQQAEAVRQALQSKISILTGGPGTGKTTILRALVSILRARRPRCYWQLLPGGQLVEWRKVALISLRLFIGY